MLITGFVRPQLAFESLDDLIKAINADIEFGAALLEKEPHSNYLDDEFITKEVHLPVNGNDDEDDGKQSDEEPNDPPVHQHKPKSSL